MSTSIRAVKDLKDSLSKEMNGDGSVGGDNSERCTDILGQLDSSPMTLQILTETLVGTVVSKFKKHSDPSVAAKAKALVKKWKQLATQSGLGASTSSGTSSSSSAAKKLLPAVKRRQPQQAKKPTPAAAAAAPVEDIAEWDHLPPLRKNTAKKFHQTFQLSSESLVKGGIHADALKSLTCSRATEVESSCHEFARGVKVAFLTKVRSLTFNLKKNESLRENVLLGATSSETLVKMTTAELATNDKQEERDKLVLKLKDSRRLDWEQANEDKINEMCGIKGELLSASLFTCGRCKSIKTTSTQKQTRSADEPMTVFVLCLNCGNRWKC